MERRRGKRRNESPKRDVAKRSRSDAEVSILDNVTIHPLLQGRRTQEVEPVKNPVKKSDWKSKTGFVLNPYIDQNDIKDASSRRQRLSEFNERGKYIEQAKKQREQQIEDLKAKEEEAQLAKLNIVPDRALGEDMYAPESPPAIEWWDQPLVNGASYDAIDSTNGLVYETAPEEDNPITIYVQHPVPISTEPTGMTVPLYLTKDEQKRVRRNDRLTSLQEKRDRIQLGLDPTPAPKIKLKNLMNVVTNEAIKNPTEIEMRVKQEVADRQEEHERMNRDRALTKEQKREKAERKIAEDQQHGWYTSVFKVSGALTGQQIYKVDVNARQLELTGLTLRLVDGATLVVVEGGEKAIKKYKKLMLRRIKWKDDSNSCQLVWEGELPRPHFHKYTDYEMSSESELVDLLARYRLENYWRQAMASASSV